MTSLLRRLWSYIRGPSKRLEVGDGTYWLAWGDSRHDDTASLQAVLDRAVSRTEAIHFPAGTFKISSTVQVGRGA